MEIDPWVWWLALALLMFLIDIAVTGATSGILMVVAIGALGGMVGALAGMNPDQQILTAWAAGLLSLPAVVWFIRRMKGRSPARGLPDPSMTGETFVIEAHNGRLVVQVMGERFPVRGVDGSSPPEGTRVRIERFSGIHALVRPVEEDTDSGTA